MRSLATIFAIAMFVMAVVSAALVAVAIQVLPYALIATAVAVLINSRRQATPRPSRLPQPYTPAPQPTHRPITPSGWVYVPVWVGPSSQPAPYVIDAEVIEDHR